MTAPNPVPKPILWGACERCRGGGSASPLDPRFCATCLPHPQVLADRGAAVERRVRQSRHAATRTQWAAVDAPIAPDAEHVWLQVEPRGVAHLFADATETSRCGRKWLGRQAHADLDTPAPENGAACRSCWTAYRTGRRGSP